MCDYDYCNELCNQHHLTKCTKKKVSLRTAANIFMKIEINIIYFFT
jgi:hypothetical protein